MADYAFYINKYCGDSIPESDFNRLAARAGAVLDKYKRMYTVTENKPDGENMALCAMADALYYYETVQSGGIVSSVSVGSVSTSYSSKSPDVSPRAQSHELFRCAGLYLDIYRGCGKC